MPLEANKALVRRLIEEDLNTGDTAVAAEVVAADFIDHTNPPGLQHGLDSHNEVVRIFRDAFPDCVWTIDDMLAEGDRVVVRLTMRGTHRGTFFGIPPTGQRVTVPGVHILRVAGGRVAEHWGATDDLWFMRQLGVVPGNPVPSA